MPVTEPPHAAPSEPPGPPGAAWNLQLADWIRTHQHMVWRYLRLLGADPHEADDLMQDTFVCFARGQQRGELLHSPPAFLRGIARNLLFAARRRSRRQVPTQAYGDALDALAGADPEAFADHRIDALRQCLQQLPERARQAIELHHVDGLSRRDLAARLGLGDEGAKSLLSRARDLLRQCVDRRAALPSTGAEP
jgi:RNA polymerase sigma-70 factor, ECF subfamily